MLQLPLDVLLHILAFLGLHDLSVLQCVCSRAYRLIVDHEATVYHQAAVLHRYVSAQSSLEDAVLLEHYKGGWLDGVQDWKELCRRWTIFVRNFTEKGVVTEGGYLLDLHGNSRFRVDESQRAIISLTTGYTLVSHSIEGELLWELSGVKAFDFSDGFLLLWRFGGSLEIWRRTYDVVASHAGLNHVVTPLPSTSPLTINKSQPLTASSDDKQSLRGQFVAHGSIPLSYGSVFRVYCLNPPHLAVISHQLPHLVLVFDIAQGELIREIDFHSLANSFQDHNPIQTLGAVLLGLDISKDNVLVCFDYYVLVAPIKEQPNLEGFSSSKRPLCIKIDDAMDPADSDASALRLSHGAWKPYETAPELKRSNDSIIAVVKGGNAFETSRTISNRVQDPQEPSNALVPTGPRRSTLFVSAKFSPNGRHIIAASARGALYLVPDFQLIYTGSVMVMEVLEKLKFGAAINEVIWKEHENRVVLWSEPGDVFLIDLNRKYHSVEHLSEKVSLHNATLRRLMDFGPIVNRFDGICVGKTRLWLPWSVSRWYKQLQERLNEEQASPDVVVDQELISDASSICFLDFTHFN